MELVVKILEDIFDVPSSTLYVFIKFATFLNQFDRAVGQGKQG
jgi:hypothetical protein